MQIARQMTVAAPPEILWRIVAEEYAEIATWASAVKSSTPNPDVPALPGAPVGGRICTVSFGEVVETIQVFDPAERRLAYEAKAKSMPFFVRRLSAQWTFEQSGAGTAVALTFDADLMAPFNLLMGWMLRRQFGTAIDDTLSDLKTHAEAAAPAIP